MNEINIDVALVSLSDTLYKLCAKHFVNKEELSEYEQNLLNDLHTVVMHSFHKEIIRKHFSVK